MFGDLLLKMKFWAGLLGAVVVGVAVAFLRGRSAGKDAMRQEQAEARERAMQARKRSDDDVDAMGDADVDRDYVRWLRDGRR